jgi:serine/threonine protein kinase
MSDTKGGGPGDFLTIQDRLEQFDAAWRHGDVPSIEAFLPPAGATGRRKVLDELIKIDLEYRWRHGDNRPGPRLEDYVARFAELSPLESLPLELIGEEYRVRQRWGDRPSPAEYEARFAWLGAPLRQLLAAIDTELAAEPLRTTPTAQAEAAAAPRPRLADYEVLGEVGRGGMGVVYKAWHKGLKRPVALKMIRSAELAGAEALDRFRREAEVVAALNHPHVVQVYEVGEQDGQPFLALEFLGGGSLDRRLGGRPQPPRDAAGLVETLARAMQAAHERGIVHRDLKPANVLLTADGTPKIADFGLAKHLGAATGGTRSGAVLGTPSYMAPEQAAGKQTEVGPAADVYALGAVLYELFTGGPPFRGETSLDTVQQVLTQEPVSPRRLQPKLPRDLETICIKCLQKEPRKRYASAAALAEDLRRFLDNTPIRARPVGPWERASKWARRRPAAAALLIVSTLAVVVFAALVVGYNVRLRRTNRELADALQRAEANFHLAREAVDEFSTRVSRDDRLRAPDAEKLRRALLQSAQRLYQKLVEQRSDDPNVQAERGQAYLHLAALSLAMDEVPQAFDFIQKAREVLEPLTYRHPENPRYRAILAEAVNSLAAAYWRTHQQELAETTFCQARDLRRQLVHDHPEEPKYRNDLADSLNNLGVLYVETGRPDLSAASHHEAQELWQQLSHAHPDHLDYQLKLGGSYFNLGILYETTGRPKEAETAYVAARDIQQKLAHDQPGKREYRAELAGTLTNLGWVYQVTRRPKLAVPAYRQAADLWQNLVADHPTITEYQDRQASTFFTIGTVCEEDFGQAQEAEAAYRKARDIGEKLVQTSSKLPDYQVGLARTLHALGQLYCETGRLAPARDNLGRAEQIRAKLVHDCPAEPNYQADLGTTYASLGVLDSRTGNARAALDRYDGAIRLLEAVLEKVPAHAPSRGSLCLTYRWRATTLEDLGRHDEALGDGDRAV